MEQLSQEVINLIATFIERYPDQPGVPSLERKVLPSNLPRHAANSLAWKHAIESIVFREITLKSTDIEAFDAIFRGDRRRSLTKLTLDIVLPNYDDKLCGRFERDSDKDANNETFTAAIEKLFAVLKSWEDDNESLNGSVRFALWNIYAPFDSGQRGYETLERHRFEAMLGQRHDLFEHRYNHSLIHLLRPGQLPSVRCVSEAHFDNPTLGRNLDMRCVVDMTMKLPCLESLAFTLNDDEKNFPKIRVENRHSFASGLSRLQFKFPLLKSADLTFFHEAPLNQAMKSADLLNGQNYDPLSTALRQTFSQCPNLTSLNLTGVFDSSLFWSSSQSQQALNNINIVPECWPNLKFLIVTFDATTPSGHWYFTGPSGDDPEENLTSSLSTEDSDSEPDSERENSPSSDNSANDPFDAEKSARLAGMIPTHQFRTLPNPTHLNPLILAFAQFVKHTASPFLRSACLTTGPMAFDDTGSHFQFEICYYAPDQTAFWGDKNIEDEKVPRLYFEVGDWVPDPEVLEELKEAGRSTWAEGEGEGEGGLLVRFCEGQF